MRDWHRKRTLLPFLLKMLYDEKTFLKRDVWQGQWVASCCWCVPADKMKVKTFQHFIDLLPCLPSPPVDTPGRHPGQTPTPRKDTSPVATAADGMHSCFKLSSVCHILTNMENKKNTCCVCNVHRLLARDVFDVAKRQFQDKQKNFIKISPRWKMHFWSQFLTDFHIWPTKFKFRTFSTRKKSFIMF